MKTILRLFSLLVSIAAGLYFSDVIGYQWYKVTSPKTVVYTAKSIVTMDENLPWAQAVVVEDGRILAVGDKAQLLKDLSDKPYVIDEQFADKTIMPGFIEQHLHPLLGALTLSMAVIAPEAWELPDKTWPAAIGRDDYLAKLAGEEKLSNEDVLFSWGYHQYFHGDLSRAALDEISASRPIVVWHRSCHEFYLNTAAIEKYGITQKEIDAAGDEVAKQSNIQRGHFYENGAFQYIVQLIMPDLASPTRLLSGLSQMIEILHSNGVTAFNEPGALVDNNILLAYKLTLQRLNTPLYSFFIPEAKTSFVEFGAQGVLTAVEGITQSLPQTGKARFFDKQVKLLMDGAIISQLMQMKDGYLDGHHGEWIQTPEEIDTLTKIFWDAGYQIHIHVNGDLGLEELLTILENRMQENPRVDHRTTIVHFANSAPEHIQRLKDLGAIVSANPYYVTAFANKYSEFGVGPERAQAMVRLAPLEELGVSISLHSDLPMAPADPLYLAWAAVTRDTLEGGSVKPELGLSVDKALRAITIDAAYSWRMEDEIGSITKGKVANFTVLDENPYEVMPAALKDIGIWGTVFEGRVFQVID
ncbi:MAG: putative amidohydrolase YtcJ [Pseudoalteromonas tetraodonis]|jgi:predicted amidohydrolase YtcJ